MDHLWPNIYGFKNSNISTSYCVSILFVLCDFITDFIFVMISARENITEWLLGLGRGKLLRWDLLPHFESARLCGYRTVQLEFVPIFGSMVCTGVNVELRGHNILKLGVTLVQWPDCFSVLICACSKFTHVTQKDLMHVKWMAEELRDYFSIYDINNFKCCLYTRSCTLALISPLLFR